MTGSARLILKVHLMLISLLRFTVITCLLFLVNTNFSHAANQITIPNVLWVISEDMGPELGCYGTKELHTPNLDQLAKQGMRFTNAFTTCPVCSASRSAFMTGMYQTTIGAHNHRSHRNDNYRLPAGVKVLPQWFSGSSLSTKIYSANIRNLSKDRKDRFYRGTGKTDWNFNLDQPLYASGKNKKKNQRKPIFDSRDWNELKSHQPFCAQINFSETHRGHAWNDSHNHIDKPADPDKVIIPPYYPDHPLTRKDWAQYLNTVMALDKKVGYVLKRLKEDKLDKNTIVIFFGDHGRAMMRGKQWCYDSGLHIPLIVYYPPSMTAPEGYKAGTVSDQLVSAIDLTATTLDALGVAKPQKMQGRILFGSNAEPQRDYVFAARDRCDETLFRIRTVRNKRYRYIRNFMPKRPFLQLNRYKERTYPVIGLMRELHKQGKLTPAQAFLMAPSRPAEELYDTQADPWETVNLAESPKFQEIKSKLKRELTNWITSSNDMGRIPESEAIIKAEDARARATTERVKKQNNRK